MPTISVIVPVYKVEEYLPACIRSILRQTYRDFELILVDDGSPDRCGAICDEFAKLDERIRVIHQKNGGVSGARNSGLDIAQGKYICFIDSDDLIAPNYIETFVSGNDNSDIKIQGLVYLEDNIPKEKISYRSCTYKAFKEPLTHNMYSYGFPFCKLFKNEIIKKHHIRFNTELRFGEDCLFYYEYLSHCKTICEINSNLYFYRRGREDQATDKIYSPEELLNFKELALNSLNSTYYNHGLRKAKLLREDFMIFRRAVISCFLLNYAYERYKMIIDRLRKTKAFSFRSCPTGKSYSQFFLKWIIILCPPSISYVIIKKRIEISKKGQHQVNHAI